MILKMQVGFSRPTFLKHSGLLHHVIQNFKQTNTPNFNFVKHDHSLNHLAANKSNKMDEENVEAQKNQHDTSSSMVVIDQHQHNKNRDSVAKALLELQFEAHFRIIQLMGCYIATVMSIYDAVNAIATNSGNLPITYTATLYSK